MNRKIELQNMNLQSLNLNKIKRFRWIATSISIWLFPAGFLATIRVDYETGNGPSILPNELELLWSSCPNRLRNWIRNRREVGIVYVIACKLQSVTASGSSADCWNFLPWPLNSNDERTLLSLYHTVRDSHKEHPTRTVQRLGSASKSSNRPRCFVVHCERMRANRLQNRIT